MKYFYLATLALVTGCGDVSGYVVDKAMQACEAHKGIHRIVTDLHARHAECNDGTYQLDLHERRGK